jgi:hypothetical protein
LRDPGKQGGNQLNCSQSDRAFFSNHDHEAGSLLKLVSSVILSNVNGRWFSATGIETMKKLLAIIALF